MPPRLTRILFAIEFLLALMAALTLWSQSGGQYHLDLMPWYWKLGLTTAAALAFTRLTMCWAGEHLAGRRSMLLWLLALLLIIACAGAVTYYYHLYEPTDSDENPDQTTVTSATILRQRLQREPVRRPARQREPAFSVG